MDLTVYASLMFLILCIIGISLLNSIIEFIVPGNPVGKGRPKFARRGKFVQTYTPEKTVSYENLIKLKAEQAMQGMDLIAGPVKLGLNISVSIPASWSKKKKAAAVAGEIKPTTKPDIDNIVKAVGDAMNNIVFKDDSQIFEVSARKAYAEIPGVRVIVEF